MGVAVVGRQTGRRSAASVCVVGGDKRRQALSSVVEAVTEVVRQQDTFVYVCVSVLHGRTGRGRRGNGATDWSQKCCECA
jgi:hypothetical protein